MEIKLKESRCLRTVIVVDHGPAFLKTLTTVADVEGGGPKQRSAQSSPLTKPLWTMVVEGAVEYCRIIYDVLPNDYMVQVIASGKTTSRLNSFQKEEQNVSQILKGFGIIGHPEIITENETEMESSIFPGLKDGTISLLESLFSNSCLKASSNAHSSGQLILLTSFLGDKETKSIIGKVSEIQDSLDCQKDCHIDLVIVNVSATCDYAIKERKKISSVLTVSTMSLKAAQLPIKMSLLARKNFSLQSTTIFGIPMKEEQHAGSSANYDVEVIHPGEVHHETYLLGANSESQSGNSISTSSGKKDALMKNVVSLKWCTPKGSTNNELLQCIGAYRCTPAEVNSRPAACLISFLQQGRTVLLEQPKRSGSKVLSHMLSSHGGDVYIHVLATGRSSVEDPPSISEGCGGRVTDYRIGDFGKFMKENRLAPFTLSETSAEKSHTMKALLRLERGTRHWPMAIGETLIFNMSSQLEPLLSHLLKRELDEDDLQECKKVIYKLQAMESRNDTLPLPIISMRGKGSKREEQYRQLWSELETFIKEASRTSLSHSKVHECLHVVQGNHAGSSGLRNKDSKQAESFTIKGLEKKEPDQYSRMNEHDNKIISDAPSDPRKRKTVDVSENKNNLKKKPDQRENYSFNTSLGGKTNLLAIWANKMKNSAVRFHKEFEGSKHAVDGKTELYQDTNKELNQASLNNTSSVKEWV